jgi:DNA-binding IclR family transcriptional regulator
MNSSYTIQSVARALDVLIWLSEHEGRDRITDLAQALGCSKNTAFRLLYTLMERNFVRQSEDASYQLTFRLLTLGESVLGTTELHHLARPSIQELARQCGETVSLAVLEGDEIIYLDRVLGSSPFTTAYSIGSRAPACTTALGKAILAFSPEDVVERCLHDGLRSRTPHTITSPDRLRLKLREAARCCYALDNQENVLGVRCVGAPIFDRKGRVQAAISISGLAAHFSDERVQELIEPLLQTARSISAQLGFDKPCGAAGSAAAGAVETASDRGESP